MWFVTISTLPVPTASTVPTVPSIFTSSTSSPCFLNIPSASAIPGAPVQSPPLYPILTGLPYAGSFFQASSSDISEFASVVSLFSSVCVSLVVFSFLSSFTVVLQAVNNIKHARTTAIIAVNLFINT